MSTLSTEYPEFENDVKENPKTYELFNKYKDQENGISKKSFAMFAPKYSILNWRDFFSKATSDNQSLTMDEFIQVLNSILEEEKNNGAYEKADSDSIYAPDQTPSVGSMSEGFGHQPNSGFEDTYSGQNGGFDNTFGNTGFDDTFGNQNGGFENNFSETASDQQSKRFSMQSVPPPFVLPPEHFDQFEKSFQTYQQNDIITGQAVKPLFEVSQLPNDLLFEIWNLCDRGYKGSLTYIEFMYAMFFIKMKKMDPNYILPETVNMVPKGGNMGHIPDDTPSEIYSSYSQDFQQEHQTQTQFEPQPDTQQDSIIMSEANAIQMEIQKLIAENQQLNFNTNQLQSMASQQSKSALMNDMDQWKQKLDAAQAANQSIRDDYARGVEEVTQLEMQVASLQRRINASHQFSEVLKQSIQSIKTQHDELAQQKRELENTYSKEESNQNDLKTQLNALQETSTRLANELSQKKQSYASVSSSLDAQKSEIESLNSTIDNLKNQLANQDSPDSLQQQAEELKKDITTHKETIQSLENDLSEKKKQHESLNNEITTLQTELTSQQKTQQQNQTDVSKLDGLIQKLTQQRVALQSKLENLPASENQNDDLEKKLRDAHDLVSSLLKEAGISTPPAVTTPQPSSTADTHSETKTPVNKNTTSAGFGDDGFGNDDGFGDDGFGDDGFGDDGFGNDGFGNDDGFDNANDEFGNDGFGSNETKVNETPQKSEPENMDPPPKDDKPDLFGQPPSFSSPSSNNDAKVEESGFGDDDWDNAAW